jgi:YfiH family protein
VTASGWRLEKREGLLLVRCDAVARIPGIGHAFSTRCADDAGDFDLGGPGPVDDRIAARRRRLVSAAGLGTATPVVLRQVHGDAIVRAAEAADGTTADAAWWIRAERGSRVPSVRTADCVPILLVDRLGRGAAAVHAGWRGTARGVAKRAVEALRSSVAGPGDLIAALGPAILPCCYEVEASVHGEVARACGTDRGLGRSSPRPGRFLLDLHAANRLQLERAGVGSDRIHTAPWCTRCREDLFFSYRRDGEGAGRQMAVVAGCACGSEGLRP